MHFPPTQFRQTKSCQSVEIGGTNPYNPVDVSAPSESMDGTMKYLAIDGLVSVAMLKNFYASQIDLLNALCYQAPNFSIMLQPW